MARYNATIALLTAVILLVPHTAPAYSILTHEQIIDLLWKDRLVPLIKKRFPQTTEQDLIKAHAFAYGGSMVQDMGYYPFGNKFFSDLLHYVRTGDFVMTLITDASDVNEYAFALGALAHYTSDNAGHPTVNRVVAIEFPKLEKKYGHEVTYEDDPKAHIRTEFGFDMVQVAKNRYTSDRYHDFIGFEVSQGLLERAFQETYGIPLHDVLRDEDLAIGTFRWSVSRVIPETTRVALLSRKKEMVAEDPNFDKRKFLYYLSRADYEKEWGQGYRRPGIGARFLAFLLRVVPKVGPFKAASFQIPTRKTEDMYIRSVDKTVEDYSAQLREWDGHRLRLENKDCDTGRPTVLGEYGLADATYAKLLDKLAEQNFAQSSPELRTNILDYFDHRLSATSDARLKKGKDEERLQKELEQLRAAGGQEPGGSGNRSDSKSE
jgi:hypothetical protein